MITVCVSKTTESVTLDTETVIMGVVEVNGGHRERLRLINLAAVLSARRTLTALPAGGSPKLSGIGVSEGPLRPDMSPCRAGAHQLTPGGSIATWLRSVGVER